MGIFLCDLNILRDCDKFVMKKILYFYTGIIICEKKVRIKLSSKDIVKEMFSVKVKWVLMSVFAGALVVSSVVTTVGQETLVTDDCRGSQDSSVSFVQETEEKKSCNEIYRDMKASTDVKENLFVNLLNGVDYYDTAQGTFRTTFIDPEKETMISYSVDIPNQLAWEEAVNDGMDIITYYQDRTYVEVDEKKRAYAQYPTVAHPDLENRERKTTDIYEFASVLEYRNYEGEDISRQRVLKNDSGEMEYYYRNNLTNADWAATSLFSQDLIFGFLTDLDSWDITGVEEYLGRQVIVICGSTADVAYAEKLHCNTFEMRFDIESGILLDFEGYDSDGMLSQYLKTEEISIDVQDEALKTNIVNNVKKAVDSYTVTQ